ncbi:hypothetical protein FRC12_018971 [Ceratobasidium sp. 428]|nr:hypothetical protein FRC12_018971 [Ceratobasidium sp. 428]
MEVVKNLLEARSALEKAASDFLEACATLKLVAIPSLASATGRMTFEKNINNILSGADCASLVADRMFKSRTILNELLNLSISRVPINNLPAETLSHVFTLVAASSPCNPVDTQRDTLLDIPQVCIKWNQIASGTPSLWSHIDIDLSRSTISTALGRAQIWLNRCHNMPIHLHLTGGYGRVTQHHIPEILVAIQSHRGLLSSLLVSKSRHYSLIHVLLGSAPDHALSGSLKTLFLSGIHDIDSQENISSLHMNSLRELVVLDLFDLSGSTCPSIDGLAELLSSCSTLHTIRLRYLESLPGSLQTYPTIPLPQLRLLEVSRCDDILALLAKIAPGNLELDIRLDTEYIGDDQDSSPGQLLLARSNVVSLFINGLEDDSDQQPTLATFLTSVPRLRALQTNSFYLAQDFALMLEATVDEQAPLQVPYLQALCLVNWAVNHRAVHLIERILRRRKLRNLAFLACDYSSSFSQPIDVDEENGLPSDHDDDNSNLDTGIYQNLMPQSMRDWFSTRVESVVLCDEIDHEGFYHGVDPFVQKLIQLG